MYFCSWPNEAEAKAHKQFLERVGVRVSRVVKAEDGRFEVEWFDHHMPPAVAWVANGKRR